MNHVSRKVARFGLLTALALILGLADRAIPLSALLGGAVPGVKLGLANTVLLYAVYLMNLPGCVLLMLLKVILSGFLFGSLSAMLYSLAGGVLSLAAMLLFRRFPRAGALGAGILAAVADISLLAKSSQLSGQRLWIILLIALAAAGAFLLSFLLRRQIVSEVVGVSLAGAIFHNIGQIAVASAALHAPQLMTLYLPVLVGVGALVGSLTGLAADRVFRALRLTA